MVIRARKNCIILKRNVRNAFKIILVTPYQQWLLEFIWKKKYYKETCLLFCFSTASFIFNLFDNGLHWILVSYLGWVLVYYLDNFVAIFTAVQTLTNQKRHARIAYNWVTNLLGILRNDLKDIEGTLVIVFKIEIDIRKLIVRLPNNKLEKAVKVLSNILAKQFVTFPKIQSLVKFFSFCSQAMHLGRLFIRKLWDFVNEYPQSAAKLT